jgi:hypothetical protein
MLQTYSTVACSMLMLNLMSFGVANARQMHVLNSTPDAEAIMHGRNMQYVVRFDGPVDHVHSHLEIVRDGRLIEILHPLLDSAPNVIFATSTAPEVGRYVLHWSVRSMRDGDSSEGMIPFSVAE